MASNLSLTVALIAGLISFLSPCVLPIIPGFLAYLSGTTLENQNTSARFYTFLNSVFFVLGFAFIFALLGVLLNTVLSNVAYDAQTWFARVGGVIIIFFGLYLTGLIKIGFLEREHKFRVTTKFRSRYVTSFAFGAAFAAGWTPCVGAALGAIIGLAASAPGSAFILLMTYALGLGIPFLIVGFFAGTASNLIIKYARALTYVNLVFGIILIGLGILIFTEQLSRLANFELLNAFLLK